MAPSKFVPTVHEGFNTYTSTLILHSWMVKNVVIILQEYGNIVMKPITSCRNMTTKLSRSRKGDLL